MTPAHQAPAGAEEVTMTSTTSTPAPAFPALGHVAVTVTDLPSARAWYSRLFDAPPVLDEDTGVFHHAVYALGGTLFGVHAFPGGVGPAADGPRAGLDHIAFGCASRAELVRWRDRLDELGIERGDLIDAPYGSGVSFRDPDGTPLEFFAPPEAVEGSTS